MVLGSRTLSPLPLCSTALYPLPSGPTPLLSAAVVPSGAPAYLSSSGGGGEVGGGEHSTQMLPSVPEQSWQY